jgi:hypothetical protein
MAVLDVLSRYYEGLYRGDTSLLHTAFHPEAHYLTASGGDLLHLDMETYLPIVEERLSPERRGDAYGFYIDSVAFAGPVTAVARMHSTMLSKTFIDLLTLVRIDGEWKIIAKVFHYDEITDAADIRPAASHSGA